MFERRKLTQHSQLFIQNAKLLCSLWEVEPEAMTPFQRLALMILCNLAPINKDSILNNSFVRADIASMAWLFCNNALRNHPGLVRIRNEKPQLFDEATCDMDLSKYIYISTGIERMCGISSDEYYESSLRGEKELSRLLEEYGTERFLEQATLFIFRPDYSQNMFCKWPTPLVVLPYTLSMRIKLEIDTWFASFLPLLKNTVDDCVSWSLSHYSE